jgi:hypothetical protein
MPRRPAVTRMYADTEGCCADLEREGAGSWRIEASGGGSQQVAGHDLCGLHELDSAYPPSNDWLRYHPSFVHDLGATVTRWESPLAGVL